MKFRRFQRISHGSFNQRRFAELLRKGKGERSFKRYAEDAGISPSYFSRLERCLLENPPEPSSLWAIANASCNGITYEDLMMAAGHVAFRQEESDTHWKVRALRAKKALSQAITAINSVAN